MLMPTKIADFAEGHVKNCAKNVQVSEKVTWASTICQSFGELTVTPNDSDVTWKSDGHMTDHLLVTSTFTNRSDVNRSDKQMVSHYK